MDLLGSEPKFALHDREWRIYSRNNAEPPHFVGEKAEIRNTIVTEGCKIYGVVENCVLSNGVIVEEGAYVCDSVIMSDVRICRGANVNNSIVGSGTVVGAGSSVGKPKDVASGITLLSPGLELEPETIVPAGTMLNASDR